MSDLELPPGMRWSCIGCGRSCEGWSEIAVEPEAAERLRRLPLFDPRLEPEREGGLPYRASEREAGQLLLRSRLGEDGVNACVLLDRDRRCAVHAAHGAEAKPAACRSFPFVFVETPDGWQAAVSFACTAVRHELGEPLAGQGVAIRELQAIATHRERRGRGIRLAPGHVLRWDQYRGLLAELGQELGAAPSVAEALRRQGALLRARAGLAPADPRPSHKLRRFVLGWLSGLAGGPPRLRLPVAGLAAPAPERLLRRWLEHRLWRHDLLRGDEVAFAHGLLMAEVALAREWAGDQPERLEAAVAEVERGLALHSDLVERLERDAHLRATAERQFLAPRYAASLS